MIFMGNFLCLFVEFVFIIGLRIMFVDGLGSDVVFLYCFFVIVGLYILKGIFVLVGGFLLEGWFVVMVLVILLGCVFVFIYFLGFIIFFVIFMFD